MRATILFITIFILLPYCFMYPWVGILTFSWLGYMNPHKYAWGYATHFQFALIVAIVTLAGYVVTSDKDRFHMERETVLILILWLIFSLTTITAFNPSVAFTMWQKTSKVLLMVLLTLPLINTKDKLRYLVLVIALSLGFLGFKGGLFTVLTGGVHNVRGPDNTFIAGEGDFALALNMVLPVLFFQARNETKKWIRIILYSFFFFSIISVIFTNRRGGFISLAVVILFIFLKSKRHIFIGIFLAAAIFSAPYWIPEKWFNRMETIQTYEEDYSAMGRINAWKMAWNIVLDRPLTGGGFETWRTAYRIKYRPPGATVIAGDVHSIYFEMLQEHGFIAFFVFIGLLLSVLVSMQNLKRKVKNIKSCSWISNYADMLQVSILAYMAGGAFLGRAYFDLFYHLVIISVLVKVFAKRELEQLSQGELVG